LNNDVAALRDDAEQRAAVEEVVLDVVRDIVAEVCLESDSNVRVTLDSLLENELELFSLERVELAMRLAAHFQAALPEDAVASADSVRDLAAAIAGAGDVSAGRLARAPSETTEPASASTAHPAASWLYQLWVVLLLLGATIVLWPALKAIAPGPGALRIIRGTARVLFAAAGIRVTATGLHHLAGVAPAVLLANHESYLDSAVLVTALPDDVTFVVNERLTNATLIGSLVRAGRSIVVDRTTVSR